MKKIFLFVLAFHAERVKNDVKAISVKPGLPDVIISDQKLQFG
jgi:hypothetical protein